MELYQALITLDGWTFLAQICNLMIQMLIFKKFLLNPVKKVIAERKAKADSQIADAAKPVSYTHLPQAGKCLKAAGRSRVHRGAAGSVRARQHGVSL